MTAAYLATSTLQIASNRVEATWVWYVVRAAGFTAAFLIGALILSGIGQVTGLTYRFLEPIKAWTLHKAMAIALLVAIAIHMIFIVLDKFVSFNIPQVLIPFLSQYNNGTTLLGLSLGALAVSFGIFAMYGVVVIVASSLGWIDSRKKAWRWLHYLSYAVAVLLFFHVLYAGTDVKYGTFRAAWIGLGLVLVVGVIYRLTRSGTLKD